MEIGKGRVAATLKSSEGMLRKTEREQQGKSHARQDSFTKGEMVTSYPSVTDELEAMGGGGGGG